MNKQMRIWIGYTVASILQLSTWYHIWKQVNVSPYIYQEEGLDGIGLIIEIVPPIVLSVISFYIWFYFYILLRHSILKDLNIKKWNLVLGLFPLAIVAFFVYA